MSSQHYLNVLVVDRDEATNLALKEISTEDGHRVTTLSEPARLIHLPGGTTTTA